MKNKLTIIAIFAAFLTSFSAIAQEPATNEAAKKETFAAHKAQVISSLNKEKSIIDSSISCISAAASKEAVKTCHDQRKASMSALRGERMEDRKENLQKRVGKINEKIEKIDQKAVEKATQKK